MKTELLHSNSSKSLLNMSLVRESSNSSLFTNEELHRIESSSRKSSDGTVESVESSAGSSSSLTRSNSTEGNGGVGAFCQNWYKSTFRKKTVRKRLPILNWSRHYSFRKFTADCIAGITVGLTILPQGLAYASLAGLPPQVCGFIYFLGFIVSLFCVHINSTGFNETVRALFWLCRMLHLHPVRRN